MEEQKEEHRYYACCPKCKHVLMQGKNGSDCYIKCMQCGSIIHIIVKEDSVITKEKE